jgi:hypothetical protein
VFGSYQPIFAFVGGGYVAGILVIQRLNPALTRVTVEAATR